MPVNTGNEQDRMSNCAMCTIAAIADTDTATIAKILNAGGQSDDHLAAGLHVGGVGKQQQQGVLNRMINLIEQLLNHRHRNSGTRYKGVQFGFAGNYKTSGQIKQYMQSKRTGSFFAVWGYQTEEMEGLGAHWNFATTIGPEKRVEFRDYQDNVDDRHSAAVSADFLAPNDSRDDNVRYNSFIVLAFEEVPQ